MAEAAVLEVRNPLTGKADGRLAISSREEVRKKPADIQDDHPLTQGADPGPCR